MEISLTPIMPLQLDILMLMDHQIMLCSISIFYYEMHHTLLLLIMLRQWICAKIIFQIASSNIMYSRGYLSLCLIDRRGHECNVYHCVNKISVFGNFDVNVLVNVQCFHKICRRFLLVESVPMSKRQTDSSRAFSEFLRIFYNIQHCFTPMSKLPNTIGKCKYIAENRICRRAECRYANEVRWSSCKLNNNMNKSLFRTSMLYFFVQILQPTLM